MKTRNSTRFPKIWLNIAITVLLQNLWQGTINDNQSQFPSMITKYNTRSQNMRSCAFVIRRDISNNHANCWFSHISFFAIHRNSYSHFIITLHNSHLRLTWKKPPKASRQTSHEQHARSTIIGSAKGYKMKFLKITILLPIKEDIPLMEHLRY